MGISSTSDRVYWALLIVGLIIFVVVDITYFIPWIRDFGVNMLTDAIFALFTILFVDRLAVARGEKKKGS